MSRWSNDLIKCISHCVVTCTTGQRKVECRAFTITLPDFIDLTSTRVASKLHHTWKTKNGSAPSCIKRCHRLTENRGTKPGELRGRICLDQHKMHRMSHCHGEHQNLLSSHALVHVDAERTELPLRCSQRHKNPWDLEEQHDVLVALLKQSQGAD